MRPLFYTHLIEIESIITSLDEMDLSKEEKLYLAHLVESTLHHTILDMILAQLDSQDKRVFMTHLSGQNHDQIWDFLNTKVRGIENKIKQVGEDLKKELRKDIEEAKIK